ncbi:hypothetical protein QFC20_002772 [Naganishia adeliensis]|uniref:Uncharacterized protein n=1 Tax=Naganishia adeliensis TaxID=92952 RepID=A0ACC2WI27_9TREE|nr:hypothetical protein QFC20_002772 [Naganishia adeliensis]
MCITFWYTPAASAPPPSSTSNLAGAAQRASQTSPYAFILLSNRDLELGRPALDAAFHDFEQITVQPFGKSKARPTDTVPPSASSTDPHDAAAKSKVTGRTIISGRDAADPVGGTWLGMGTYHPGTPQAHARIGVLTNIHDDSPVPKGTRTRGALIKDWLKSAPLGQEEREEELEEQTRRYLDGLKDDAVKLAGFNLLLFDVRMDGDSTPDSRIVRHVSALQLTNRYRPTKSNTSYESSSIPAQQSSITTGTTTRTLPISSNPSHETTSPLGTFQAAITELKPTALEMGGMSNSLLEEPFVKVHEGVADFEKIVASDFGRAGEWDEAREQGLLDELFGLMHESHPVATFQDLEKSICVPLCTIPLPGMSGTSHPRTAECGPDDTCWRNHSCAELHHAHVNSHTMLSTPIVTPEGSPRRPGSKALPSSEELGRERDRSRSPTTGPAPAQHTTVTHLHGQRPYGTRLTTIILVRWTGEVTYVERDVWWMDEMGCVHKGGTEERRFTFSL